MADTDRILMTAYDRTGVKVGMVADPVSVDGDVKHNGRDSWSVRLKADDPMLPTLEEDGASIAFDHRGARVSSGKVGTITGDVLGNGDVVLEVEGDTRILEQVLAWPRPKASIRPTQIRNDNVGGGQGWYPALSSEYTPGTVDGQVGYYYWAVGLAEGEDAPTSDTLEGVVRAMLRANLVTRLGLPVNLWTDQARGGPMFDALNAGIIDLGTVRFGTLLEAIQPALDAMGVGIRVLRDAAGQLQVEMYDTKAWAAPLTPGSGVLANGSYTRRRPTLTRAIVGGPGELAARAFREYRDTTEDRELRYADVIEVLRDATGGTLAWPMTVPENRRVPAYFHLRPEVGSVDRQRFESYLEAAGRKALRETGETTSLNVALAESGSFRIGSGSEAVAVGDTVTVRLGARTTRDGVEVPPVDVQDRITQVSYTWTRGNGVKVTPVLGKRDNDPSLALAKIVRAIASAQRRLTEDR